MVNPPKQLMMPEMPPMMPFDPSRFDCPPMVPPMFPFQMPPVGMPGIPIPPPPAPHHAGPDTSDYKLELAAMGGDLMQPGGFGQPPLAPQYSALQQPLPPRSPPPRAAAQDPEDEPGTVDPYVAAEIASVVHTLTSSQLRYALAAFKVFLESSPANAKLFLSNNPQLLYALIHAQYVLGGTDRSFLSLGASDSKIARMNRRERLAASPKSAADDTADDSSDMDYKPRAGKGKKVTTIDGADEPAGAVSPVVDSAKADPAKQDSARSAPTNRKRPAKSKGDGPTPSKRSAKSQKDRDTRLPGGRVSPANGPLEVPPPVSPPPEPVPPPMHHYESPRMFTPPAAPPIPPAPQLLVPSHIPAPPPMPIPPHVPMPPQMAMPRTIEDIVREVPPAPPILVEEVLKNTEILTNIQRATVAEMESWPIEQRHQVLSIKLALHYRGISINL